MALKKKQDADCLCVSYAVSGDVLVARVGVVPGLDAIFLAPPGIVQVSLHRGVSLLSETIHHLSALTSMAAPLQWDGMLDC